MPGANGLCAPDAHGRGEGAGEIANGMPGMMASGSPNASGCGCPNPASGGPKLCGLMAKNDIARRRKSDSSLQYEPGSSESADGCKTE